MGQNKIKISLQNLGTVNQNKVTIEKGGKSVVLYFSYETLVAVDNIVSENDWSTTTGKLLNKLCRDKTMMCPHGEVLTTADKRLKEILG